MEHMDLDKILEMAKIVQNGEELSPEQMNIPRSTTRIPTSSMPPVPLIRCIPARNVRLTPSPKSITLKISSSSIRKEISCSKRGGPMSAGVKLELLYICIEIDGEEKLEKLYTRTHRAAPLQAARCHAFEYPAFHHADTNFLDAACAAHTLHNSWSGKRQACRWKQLRRHWKKKALQGKSRGVENVTGTAICPVQFPDVLCPQFPQAGKVNACIGFPFKAVRHIKANNEILCFFYRLRVR